MSLCLQNHTLSPFVIMSFCLKKCICLAPSLCYSVFKTTPSDTPVLLLLCLQNYPVSLCHYVILSKNHPCPPRPSVILSSRPPLLLLLSSCYSVFKITLSPFVIMSFCLKNHTCLAPSLCYSVFKNDLVWLLILLHISCLRSAFSCCTFASSSRMKTVTGWAFDDRRG